MMMNLFFIFFFMMMTMNLGSGLDLDSVSTVKPSRGGEGGGSLSLFFVNGNREGETYKLESP